MILLYTISEHVTHNLTAKCKKWHIFPAVKKLLRLKTNLSLSENKQKSIEGQYLILPCWERMHIMLIVIDGIKRNMGCCCRLPDIIMIIPRSCENIWTIDRVKSPGTHTIQVNAIYNRLIVWRYMFCDVFPSVSTGRRFFKCFEKNIGERIFDWWIINSVIPLTGCINKVKWFCHGGIKHVVYGSLSVFSSVLNHRSCEIIRNL